MELNFLTNLQSKGLQFYQKCVLLSFSKDFAQICNLLRFLDILEISVPEHLSVAASNRYKVFMVFSYYYYYHYFYSFKKK